MTHDHCTTCGSYDARVFRSLVTIPSMGITDVGEACCLDIDLSRFTLPTPPAPIEGSVALKLLALGLR